MILFWILFNLFVLVMLALDLGVFNRRPHSIGFREALGWSVMWVALAISFAVVVYFFNTIASIIEIDTVKPKWINPR